MSTAIRAIAWIDGVKGVGVLAAAGGCLSLADPRADAWVTALLQASHLHALSRLPRVFIDALAHPNERQLVSLAAVAASYGLLCLVEAWGLYAARRWAQWLAALNSAWFVPFEVQHLARHPGMLGGLVLFLNLAVFGVMVRALVDRPRPAPRRGRARRALTGPRGLGGRETGRP